jgi:uncharacterized protein (DUF2267 family)
MNDLTPYYQIIQTQGNLRTPQHAQRWSMAVLKTLGFNLDGRTKKRLAKALPQELATDLTRVFWLVHFRNSNLPVHEFQNQVSRRSGNSDPNFAKTPILAVFSGLKAMIDNDMQTAVSKTLSPEVRALWDKA